MGVAELTPTTIPPPTNTYTQQNTHAHTRTHTHSIGWPHLEESVAAFKDHMSLTALVPDITGVDPDDAFSSVPYEKGFSLLVLIEQIVRACVGRVCVGVVAKSPSSLSHVHTYRH